MLQSSLEAYLREAGFKPPVQVQGLGSMSDLHPQTRRAGIYVLHFADGSAYVGQSKEVAQRFKQHSSALDDIVSLSFKVAKKADLDRLERTVIGDLEALAIPLRNRALVSMPGTGTEAFDELFSPVLQDTWSYDLDFVDAGGERPDDEDQRRRYAERFRSWNQENGEAVGRFLRAYVPTCIPAFKRTEWVWWSASCLKGRRSGWCPLSRISINWQEVLCIWRDGAELGAYLQLAYSPLEAAYGEGWDPVVEVAPSAELEPDGVYDPGGADQVRIWIHDLGEAERFIRLRPVARAIRKFNLGLMMRGKTVWPRSHCFQVADLIYQDPQPPKRESRPRSPRRQ